MAQFAPYTNSPNDPNYLGYSKTPDRIQSDIKPDTSVGTALTEIGSMFEAGMKGWDDLDKKTISREAEKQFRAVSQGRIADLEQEYFKVSGGQLPQGANGDLQGNPPGEEGTVDSTDLSGAKKQPTSGETDEGPLPGPATQRLRSLQKTAQMEAQNKITPTGALMNGEAVLSDLLQRYPNRAKEIRAMASQYGFGEGRYAQKLTSDINAIRQQQQTQNNKDEAWEQKNAPYLIGDPTSGKPGVDPSYFTRPLAERRSKEFRDRLMTRIGNIEGIQKFNEIEQQRINLEASRAEKKDIRLDQTDSWTNTKGAEIGIQFTNMMQHTMDQLGYKGVVDAGTFMETWNKDPRRNNPQLQEQVGYAFENFINTTKAKWLNQAITQKVGDKGDTVFSLVKGDNLDKIHEQLLAPYRSIQKMISDKGSTANFALASAHARVAAGQVDMKHAEILRTYPIAATIEAQRKVWGDQIVAAQYTNQTNKKAIDSVVQLMIDGATTDVLNKKKDPATDKPVTLDTTVREYVHKFGLNGPNKPIKPQDLAGLMDRMHGNLMNVETPREMAIDHAKYIFDNTKIFSQLKTDEKRKYLNKYANPDTSDRVFNLNDPALLETYTRWISTAAAVTSHETVSNFKSVIDTEKNTGKFGGYDITQFYSLTYDPKTNRLVAEFAPDSKIAEAATIKRANGVNTVDRYAQAEIARGLATVKDTRDKLNEILTVVEPMIKRDATGLPPELILNLKSMGVTIKEGADTPKLDYLDPGKRSEVEGTTQTADITNIDPSTLKMQSPSPRQKTIIDPRYPTGVKIRGADAGTVSTEMSSSNKVRKAYNDEDISYSPVLDEGEFQQWKNQAIKDKRDFQYDPKTHGTVINALDKNPEGILLEEQDLPRKKIPGAELQRWYPEGSDTPMFLLKKLPSMTELSSQSKRKGKAPVVAQEEETPKKGKSINLSDQGDIMGIQVDDIPEGMSARDFIKQLQQRNP